MDSSTLRRNNIAFYFLCAGVFFTMLSLATHLPAYPHILMEFELDASAAVWMQLGLAFGITGFQPLFGWIGDTYSQKLILIAAGVFMAIGSLLIVFSPYFWVLVVGLFFKGLSGAAVIPTGVSYAGRIFEGERRGRALGLFAFSLTIGALFGPLVSGAFVDGLGWVSIFWVAAILGIVSLTLFAIGVPAIQPEKRRKFDWPGVILTFIAMASILTVPTTISIFGFNSGLWLPSLIAFILTLIILIYMESRTKEPLLDMEYAKNKLFWNPSLIILLLGLGYSGVMYLLTFFVQDVQGRSGTLVGILQSIVFLTTSLASLLVGRYLKRLSTRITLAISILFFMIGLIITSTFNVNTPNITMFIAMAFIGTGFGMTTPILKGIIVSEVDISRINVVTYTNTVIEQVSQRLGASFALVAVGLFTAVGDAGSAISKTTIIFIVISASSLLTLRLIPKTITGIHDADDIDINTEEKKA